MVSRRTSIQLLVASIPFAAWLFGPLKSAQAKPVAGLLGRWGGQLVAGSATLRLVLVVQDGQLPILYSVDQGNQPIPADAGTVSDAALDVTFSAIKGRLMLKLTDKGLLEGTWSQGRALSLTLSRLAEGAIPEKNALKDLGDLSAEVIAGQTKYQIPALVGGFQILRGKAQVGREVVAGTLTVTDQTRVREGQLWHVGIHDRDFGCPPCGAWSAFLGNEIGRRLRHPRAQYAASLSRPDFGPFDDGSNRHADQFVAIRHDCAVWCHFA